MPYQIYDDPDIEVTPGRHADFISLQPGEQWTRTDSLELPSDIDIGEVFKYEFSDRVIDWWDWGMKEDHLQTTVKLPCWVKDDVVEPRDNEGRPAIVVPASNVVEFTIVIYREGTLLLLILSIFSFLPQLRRLHQNGDSTGVSLIYLLCNVISATEQLTISFSYIFIAQSSDFFIHNPPNVGDWLNLLQLAVTWGLSSTLFFFAISYYPACVRRKAFIVGIYIAFLSLSLLAAILCVLADPCGANCGSQRWDYGIFLGSHLIFVNPVVTLLALAALPAQLQELKWHGHAALSLTGLASQAVIFAVLSLSWLFRVRVYYNLSDFFRTWGSFISWYQLVGWAAVDHLVFAVVQGILFLIVLKRKRTVTAEGENEPLLSH
ncbi:hypothetical protein AO1008_02849 [Aspergillus oryzae 100-8]|uniref:Uncharacterized protein n=1 Tax=Aspergillus oryzae (strain 3.042) TaxID=1160506 RepID=I8IGP0_ASPO3|nr:hypothetical protein Ao3042_06355 [Aspergillus oryzae 3.042]KDE76923.1 hypothetical protein AO1008_02849 [Aspergillus oryzae 100-8]|eukprot:EIT77531.1 hypothetical protein Ao3042_06355 [Aspergillus oryzae 3.042]